MPTEVAVTPNVKQGLTFFNVTDVEASLRFSLTASGPL